MDNLEHGKLIKQIDYDKQVCDARHDVTLRLKDRIEALEAEVKAEKKAKAMKIFRFRYERANRG